ncbi:MAG TPA: zf-HC2 domain-containing protein, partial [Clostridia bacterium]
MKNCSYFIDLMSSYFDDLLDKSKLKELEEHLLTCSECSRIFSELRQTLEYCRDISDEELPPDFDKLLHERLVEEKNKMEGTVPNKRFKRILPIVASIAAGLLVTFSIN